MKTISLPQLKKESRGMTLVEVMVAVAILAIAALLLTTSFSGSFNLIQRGVDMASAGDQAFAEAEEGAGTGSAGALEFNVGGRLESVEGSYVEYREGEDPKVSFWVFETGED